VGSPRGCRPPRQRRIYIAAVDARLIAVDATHWQTLPISATTGSSTETGLRIALATFGLRADFSAAIAGNTIVVGSGIADNGSVSQPSGEVRGYDVVTGKLKWTWDPFRKTQDSGRGHLDKGQRETLPAQRTRGR